MYSQENFNKMQPELSGGYDIPAILGTKTLPKVNEWLNFRDNRKNNPANNGLHFFLDDYRFENVWKQPDRYIERLKKYAAVLSPDFSIYTDMPKALQIYQHYRKQWLGAYWQKCGVNIIPTVGWSDAESFDFCFEGIPRHSIVAVSSVGCMKKKEAKQLFIQGYEEMIKRLSPNTVLYYGVQHIKSPKIVSMGELFTNKFDRKEAL